MLSRLSLALKCGSPMKYVSPYANVLRVASSTSAVASSGPVPMKIPEDFPTKIEGPERDLVNFPRRKRPLNPGEVRLGCFPEEWFQFFYKKTGASGAYAFSITSIIFLCSKEIYVFDHEFWSGVTLIGMLTIMNKKFGPQLREYLEKELKAEEDRMDEGLNNSVQGYKDAIETEKKEQWYAEGQNVLFDAKKENVALQLEAEYRHRLMNAFSEVKKRLDYHVMTINAKRQAEHDHMVNWISEQVLKSITPQQENEALKQCITDLKALGARA